MARRPRFFPSHVPPPGRRLAALLPLAILTSTLLALDAYGQYRFDQWTADNGLPQNSVRQILQTRDRYVWLTTFDGLVRFDGVRFRVFNKSNSPGLASNRFLYLFEDRFGDLWATLETGGLVRRHQGRFTTYTEVQGYPLDYGLLLRDDGEGNLVFTLAGKYFRWWEGEFQSIGPVPSIRDRLPTEWRDKEVYPTTDDQGDIWFTDGNRLLRVRDGRVAQVYTEHQGLPGTRPGLVWSQGTTRQAISRDAEGRLWLTDLKSMQSWLMSAQPPEGIGGLGSVADTEGNYWFQSYNGGMFRARRQTVTAYTKSQGLNAREVYSLLEARDGSLWIGTWGDGLFHFKDGAFTRYGGGNSSVGYVSALFEDRAGQLWINGENRLTDSGFVRDTWPGYVAGSLGSVWTMCEDRNGAYWLGTMGGVVRYQNGVVTRYSNKDGLAGNDTKVIIPDTADGLWLGSYGGLTHYQNGTFTAWTEKDGLPGSTVRALKQDADGTLWIGTYDSGLGRFKDGRFTRYTIKDGLFDDGVFQILEDDFGWMWMSCNRGIYRVRKQELNDFADGKLKSLTCIAYNKSDGMPSTECNGGRWPAGIKTRDGKLWFPTMWGIAMIDPATIGLNSEPPPVVIEGMRIENQAVPDESIASATAASDGVPSAIQIAPGQSTFEIQYTALSFINSENLRFRYKLEGADSDWVEAGTRRTAYFSHVSPGEYSFRVIAANADGVWNEAGANLRIVVEPPFWRTWWFISLVTLATIGLIVFAWKYRVAQLRRVQVAQQAFARQLIASQEQERKRIAGELHDSLGQSLVIIRNWALLGASQLKEDAPARGELDEINTIASRAINEVREIAYNLGPYHLERLGLSNSIRDVVKRVSQVSDIAITADLDSVEGRLSREAEMGLYRIAQEALNNVVKHSQAKEARIALKRDNDGIRLLVADNGRGFNPQSVLSPAPTEDAARLGFGLNGMAERVRLLGGTLTVRSAPGQGTTVEALVSETNGIPKGEGKKG